MNLESKRGEGYSRGGSIGYSSPTNHRNNGSSQEIHMERGKPRPSILTDILLYYKNATEKLLVDPAQWSKKWPKNAGAHYSNIYIEREGVGVG